MSYTAEGKPDSHPLVKKGEKGEEDNSFSLYEEEKSLGTCHLNPTVQPYSPLPRQSEKSGPYRFMAVLSFYQF